MNGHDVKNEYPSLHRTTKLVYSIPEGAQCRLISHTEYVAVCVHPERAPWYVTHGGAEVEVEIDPTISTIVDWPVNYGMPVADEDGKG